MGMMFPLTKENRWNNLYKINLTDLTNKNVTFLVSIKDYQWTWLKKLGHASLRHISKLKNHNLVRGFPSVEFCNEQSIQRQLTTSYMPQQNGVAKRKNHIIISMVQSVLIERRVPRSFWLEAVNWVKSNPCSKNITPEEAWRGMRSFVSYFRIFGCIDFVHVPDQKRRKLNDKSTKYLLLGVSEESKAYKLYDPINKKIQISKDVKFQEDVAWDWGEAKTSRMLYANELNSMEQRARKPPTWMKDYVTSDDLTNEDAINFAMFIGADLVTYNQA
ncbi:hypothetical protein CR513_29591, partial [Mucuna pruriens]